MSKLLPLILMVLGLALGLGAGVFLKPSTEPEPCPEGEVCPEEKTKEEPPAAKGPTDFANLDRQFVVPIVNQERVAALVVASLAIEVDQGTSDAVFEVEPKLRDAFLEVLFVHAHSGGFDGQFTSRLAMKDLRERLSAVAEGIVGSSFHDVLITEIVRQDL